MKTIIIAYRCGHRLDSGGYVGPEATADRVIPAALRCPVCRGVMPAEYLGDALAVAKTLPCCVACGAPNTADNRLEYIDDPAGESDWLCIDDDACLERMRGDGEELGIEYTPEVPL